MQTQPPDVDAMLAELAKEGGKRTSEAREPEPGDVSEATVAMRRRVVAQAAEGWQSGRDGVKHLRYTHADCVDRIIAQPGISQNELAQIYGVTAAWVSIVINCDAFKAQLAARREELIDPALAASLNERFGALAQASVDRLLKKIADDRQEVTDKVLLEAASLGARATGMGQPKPAEGPNATDHLAALAHRLIDLNRPAPDTVEGEVRRID